MRAHLFFDVVKILIAPTGGKPLRNHASVDLVEVGYHLTQGQTTPMKHTLEDRAFYVTGQCTQLVDQGC